MGHSSNRRRHTRTGCSRTEKAIAELSVASDAPYSFEPGPIVLLVEIVELEVSASVPALCQQTENDGEIEVDEREDAATLEVGRSRFLPDGVAFLLELANVVDPSLQEGGEQRVIPLNLRVRGSDLAEQ